MKAAPPHRTSGKNEAGAAFLFDLDGNLLLSFDNPNPQELDGFGTGLAYANDRILIGGVQIDDLGPEEASTGAAYIYDGNGRLVTRVSDPEPQPGNWFGWNAGSYKHDDGNEQFIVGSIFNSTEFFRAGKAYLVNEDGEIEQQLASPDPGRQENFGGALAQFGNKLLVGEKLDNGGFPDGFGAVWIFEPADLGDFDLDGDIDLPDLDTLCSDLASGEISAAFDITGDELIDQQDLARFLELTGRLPGDADFDGQVTFGDFLILSANFGDVADATLWSQGDFTCSGSVGFDDFLHLASNFGKTADAATVPEPQSGWWLILFLLAGWRRPPASLR